MYETGCEHLSTCFVQRDSLLFCDKPCQQADAAPVAADDNVQAEDSKTFDASHEDELSRWVSVAFMNTASGFYCGFWHVCSAIDVACICIGKNNDNSDQKCGRALLNQALCKSKPCNHSDCIENTTHRALARKDLLPCCIVACVGV